MMGSVIDGETASIVPPDFMSGGIPSEAVVGGHLLIAVCRVEMNVHLRVGD